MQRGDSSAAVGEGEGGCTMQDKVGAARIIMQDLQSVAAKPWVGGRGSRQPGVVLVVCTRVGFTTRAPPPVCCPAVQRMTNLDAALELCHAGPPAKTTDRDSTRATAPAQSPSAFTRAMHLLGTALFASRWVLRCERGTTPHAEMHGHGYIHISVHVLLLGVRHPHLHPQCNHSKTSKHVLCSWPLAFV